MRDTPWFWLWLPVALWSVAILGVVLYEALGYGWIEYIIGACN
jgi:hypothetical protein